MKTKTPRTRITTVTCNKCAVEIYSRAQHDYRTCYCGRTTIDGGYDYIRYGHAAEDTHPIIRIRYINATRQELYDDWKTRGDKFGFFTKKGAN